MGGAKPIEIDNTSSEGELLDFEHVWNSWFYGTPVPPCYVFETIYPLFREFAFALAPASADFEDSFAEGICGTRLRCDNAQGKAALVVQELTRGTLGLTTCSRP